MNKETAQIEIAEDVITDSHSDDVEIPNVDPSDPTVHYNQNPDGTNEYAWLYDPNLSIDDKIEKLMKELYAIRDNVEKTQHALDFSEDNVYHNIPQYLKDVKKYIRNDIEYSGYDFLTLEVLFKEIETALSEYKAGEPVTFKHYVFEDFLNVALKSKRVGLKSVDNFKYLIKPFNQPYAIIAESKQRFNDLNQNLEELYNQKRFMEQQEQMQSNQEQESDDVSSDGEETEV